MSGKTQRIFQKKNRKKINLFLDALTGKEYLDISKTWCLRTDVKLHQCKDCAFN